MTDQKSRHWYSIRNAASSGSASREILIYGEIGAFGIDAAEFVKDVGQIDAREITVRINSIGGDVFDSIAIRNALRDHSARITTIVDGIAASSASFIATAGDEVVMNKSSQLMLHNAWAIVIGDANDMTRMADTLGRQNANIAAMYADKAGGTVDDWLAIMAAETWLTADEAVEADLADRVIELEPKAAASAARAAASFDRSRFRYPDRRAAPAPRIAAQANTFRHERGGDMPTTDPRSIRSEDARTVDDAIKAGKILAAERQVWLNRLKEDRPNYTYLLNALAPCAGLNGTTTAAQRLDTTPSVDRAMEAMHNKLTNPGAPGPRNLIADYGAGTVGPAEPPVTGKVVTSYDAINAEINADPDLQRMTWELGPQFRGGINKPPERVEVYPPSDGPGTPRLVDHGDGTGHWEVNQWPELR